MAIAKRGLVIGATALTVAAVTVTGAGLHLSQSKAAFTDSPKGLVDQVWQVINGEYVDATFNQVDWEAVRTQYLEVEYTSQEEAYTAIREMLALLGDPYTRFMDPQEYRNMQVDTSGRLTGVGIQISQDEETNEIVVVSPIEDTPAFEAGLRSQDVITAIDGVSTEGMSLNDAVSRIRGQEGSTVTLTIRRGQEVIDFNLIRARIEIHPVRYSVRRSSVGPVGYIRLNQFSANATAEMRAAIEALEQQGIAGYVLDLRSNPGGLLFASVEIANMWLREGTIVSTVNREGIVDQEVANSRVLTDKPLVVLVDGGSASASEILAGALQDNRRAQLVGTRTFGKGLVQLVRELRDGSGLAVTISRYLTPSGRDINRQGIEPDVVLELTEADQERLASDRTLVGTDEDPQFSRAMGLLTEVVQASRSTASRPSTPTTP